MNIARGGVIDEEALIRGLSSGRIKGAALDVFAVELCSAESPIWALSNVIFSPHSASTAVAENSHIVDIFLENLGKLPGGRPLRNVFHPGVATDLGNSRIEVVACVLRCCIVTNNAERGLLSQISGVETWPAATRKLGLASSVHTWAESAFAWLCRGPARRFGGRL